MIPGRPWVPGLDEARLRWYNDLMTTTPRIPTLRLRFTCTGNPGPGRRDQDRHDVVPADMTTVGTLLNYDYRTVDPGSEMPVGTVVAIVVPGGYVRTWTLEGVEP